MSNKKIYAFTAAVAGTCGVSVVYSFSNENTLGYRRSIENLSPAGAGLFCAGFIDTPECQNAYEQMKKTFRLLYQTPVKRNNNSGNDFFFTVWEKK